MSKTITEQREVKGILHTPYGKFFMLEAWPTYTTVPLKLNRYDVLNFNVADQLGVVKTIALGNCPWMIEPNLGQKTMTVTFVLDEEPE